MPFLNPRHRGLFSLLVTVFVLYGTSMTIFGATLRPILQEFRWDYLTAGVVIGAGTFSYFVSTFVSGLVLRRWGPKVTLVAGLLLNAVGLGLFGAVAEPWVNVGLNVLIGLGQGAFEVALNWSALRVDEQKSGGPMQVLQAGFAVGAIAGPAALGALLASSLSWTVLYRGMAVVVAAMALVFVFVRIDLAEAASSQPSRSAPLRSAVPWLAFGTLLLYVGVELGVSNWVGEYFAEVFAAPAATSSLLVSVFWFGVLVGRLGVPFVLRGKGAHAVLVVFTVGMLATLTGLPILGGLVGATGLAVGGVLVWAAGLGASIVYPSVMALAGHRFPEAQAQVVGFAATGGGIGAFLFPFVMAALSQGFGIRWGFAVYAGFALLLAVGVVALVVVAGQPTRTSSRHETGTTPPL